MPRRPRLQLAEVPLHIVQHGINREPCFFAEEDYHCYLHWLEEAARDAAVENHMVFIETRPERVQSVPLSGSSRQIRMKRVKIPYWWIKDRRASAKDPW